MSNSISGADNWRPILVRYVIMAEVTYTAGYSIMAHLGKGKAIMGMKVAAAATGDTITTPFARCVPVVSVLAGAAAADVIDVTESAGVVTISWSAGDPDDFQVIILGDLY